MWILGKLKPETSINMLLPAIVTLTGVAILWILLGRITAFGFVAIVLIAYAAFSFSAFIRTKNTGYLIAALFQLSGGLWVGGSHHGIFFLNEHLTPLFGFAAILFGVWMQILLFSKKFKWRGREILELAAQPVQDITNGFTERPRPSGKVTVSREDVLAFAQFASRNLIAMPYMEPDRVVLVPATMAQSFRHLYPWPHDYRVDTWVSIGSDGNVDVHLAKDDYLKFKDSLSFDQLCESLGQLFTEFLDMFQKGEAIRIIDRLNTVRMNPYA